LKKFFTALIGGTVLLVGVAMLVLPGPGIVVIAAGLAILATEFIWAKHALSNARDVVNKARQKSGEFHWWWKTRKRAAPEVAKKDS